MSDAIERLKNRSRATVPKRDASLMRGQNDEVTEFSHSIETASFNSNISQEQDSESEVVRRTIRLDSDIDIQLEQLCRQQKITREVFLEAAFLTCSENKQIMDELLELAKNRYRDRKQLGEHRKFKAMEQKFRK